MKHFLLNWGPAIVGACMVTACGTLPCEPISSVDVIGEQPSLVVTIDYDGIFGKHRDSANVTVQP